MKIILISTDESVVGMGVKTLSSCLIKAGFETAVVLLPSCETSLKDLYSDELSKICKDAGLICISCMTHGVLKAIEVNNFLKENSVKAPIVIGGIHATLSPESLMDNFCLVCHGEGEDALVKLASRINKGEPYDDIPGLWVKSGDEIIRNQNQPLKRDLNEYPLPDYDLSHQFILDSNRIVPMEPAHVNYDSFVVLGSRGCPHQCTYCSNHKIKKDFPWMNKVRHYSVDYLIKHLEAASLIYPGIRSFWLEDDTFFAKDFSEIKEFAERYKTQIKKPFLILISPWTYHADKVKILVEAGMNRLIMGIQSGSDNTNYNIYDRRIKNDKVLEIVCSLSKFKGMLACYDFIGMNPFEEREDLISTIWLIKKFPAPFFIFNNSLAFYPGTKLYEQALKCGLDISKRDKHGDANIGYSILRKEKIKHKVFHFLLLMMAGKANEGRIGFIPRFIISDPAIRLYTILDRKLSLYLDGVISVISFIFMYADCKLILKKVLSRKQINKLKAVYEYIKSNVGHSRLN